MANNAHKQDTKMKTLLLAGLIGFWATSVMALSVVRVFGPISADVRQELTMKSDRFSANAIATKDRAFCRIPWHQLILHYLKSKL